MDALGLTDGSGMDEPGITGGLGMDEPCITCGSGIGIAGESPGGRSGITGGSDDRGRLEYCAQYSVRTMTHNNSWSGFHGRMPDHWENIQRIRVPCLCRWVLAA
jgi:hypothetical protein